MQVSVSARHGNLQPGDQQLIEEKTERLRRLNDRVSSIVVTVDLEHLEKPVVEIKVSVEHEDDCVGSADATNVIAALDLAIPKVESQLRKSKEKKANHRAGHKTIDPATDD